MVGEVKWEKRYQGKSNDRENFSKLEHFLSFDAVGSNLRIKLPLEQKMLDSQTCFVKIKLSRCKHFKQTLSGCKIASELLSGLGWAQTSLSVSLMDWEPILNPGLSLFLIFLLL